MLGIAVFRKLYFDLKPCNRFLNPFCQKAEVLSILSEMHTICILMKETKIPRGYHVPGVIDCTCNLSIQEQEAGRW